MKSYKDIFEYFFVRRKEEVLNFKVKYFNRGSREVITLKKNITVQLVLNAKHDHIFVTS